MSDLEGVGDTVTGGLAARAVEPDAGRRGDGHTDEPNCLNCGCELLGEFCHCCGQRGRVHRTIGAWWHDFLHSVLHLDGKFWRTMPMLALRPGELTRRYAHGERAKFISPLALFLFTVFLMFAVFSLAGGPFDVNSAGAADQRNVGQQQRPTEAGGAVVLVPNAAPEGQIRTIDLRSGPIDTGAPWLDAAIEKARSNPELLLYKVQANAYKFSWALIPISVPFLWVLFLHRRRYREQLTLYDHLVFVTYSISFMSLWLVLYALIAAAGIDSGIADLAFLLVPPVHIYRQLKGAYRLSRVGALWRTLLLLLFAAIALVLFGMLLLMIGTGLI